MNRLQPTVRDLAAPTLESWGSVLPDDSWQKLDCFARDMLSFNARTNLTAASTIPEIAERHLLDSLAALSVLLRRDGPKEPRWLDLGSGGGFVGIALKIAHPSARVVLLESVERKVSFLRWAVSRLGLGGIETVHARALGGGLWQPLGPGGGKGSAFAPEPFDAVLARALAPFEEAKALALPFLKDGGAAVIYQNEPRPGSLQYRLPGEDKDRHLAVVPKEAS